MSGIKPEISQLDETRHRGRPPGAFSKVKRFDAEAPRLPGSNLSAIQVVAARELAQGKSGLQVRRSYGISRATWATWEVNPHFLNEIKARLEKADQVVEEALKEGESKAAATLILALAATTPLKLKSGKYHFRPDWETRVKAAMSLLDRRGERGKPVDRALQATGHFNPATVAKELGAALSDPVVRQFIDQDPKFAAQFRRELAALPPPEEAVCDSSDSSGSP